MKVLFITSNRIGDCVLSSGILAYLLEKLPGASITIACGPEAANLFEAMPRVSRIIPMPKRPYGGHWFALWRQVATTRWHLIVDLRASLIGQFLLARQRKTIRSSPSTGHRVRQLGLAFGLSNPPAPKIFISARHRATAQQLLPKAMPILALAPTANWGGKVWPADRFVDAATRLTAEEGILPNAKIAVFGAKRERALAEPVLAGLAPSLRIDLVGQIDLLTAYACFERSDFFLGNDSALMHLAAAAGTPTLGLFGPSREDLYGPWGPNAAAVRTDLPFAEIVAAPGYDYRSQMSRMTGLSVDKVVAAAADLWRRHRIHIGAA